MDKTQVITKDEDKVLDAELHTDLLNQSERDKIVKAGNYLEAVYDGITDPGVGGKGNTIKEKVYGKLFKEKGQESHHYIKLEEKTIDENGEIIAKDLNEKANRVQALVDSFAADLKYKGETPRILIGDLPPGVEAFASPENNTIAIDRKVLALADANKVLTLVGHELGHFNSYDANTESTAKRVEDAIQGTKNKGKYTEKLEKEFQEKYAGRDISGNEAQKVIDGISEDSRENFALTTTIVIGGVVLIGSYYSGQKTAEYLNSEEGKRAWNKFEENLKEE
ncbi:M48 family metalloprotease [Fusobacterium varium]|uniref:M48 family metalloprotease n=1 Tax=Fusobacterium varium TaxID=856 RepID=UPI00164DDFE2|nr:M48 family metalloprotease [Fusobacterium varium]